MSHAALTLPLPTEPDPELLDIARQWVLIYPDWAAGDLAFHAASKELAHAIKLGAGRLRDLLGPGFVSRRGGQRMVQWE